MPSTREAERIAQERVVEVLSRHASYLHRASTAQVNEIHRLIDEMGKELASELHIRLDSLSPAELAAFTAGRYTTTRLKGLRSFINLLLEKFGQQISQMAAEGFQSLAGHEVAFAHEMMSSVLKGKQPAAPTAAAVFAKAMAQPLLGELVEETLADIPVRTRRQIYSTIRQGIADGLPNAEIVRALRGTKALKFKDGILRTARKDVERDVRTARNHISNMAYQETYAALGVEYVVWVSTLDGRTSKICASRDGQRWKVGTAHPIPPAHPNCRSILAPSFEDMIMGRRPYVRAFKPIGQIPKNKRPEGMVGQVSATTNYAKWFKRQPTSYQREWLGPSRYKLYHEGGYTLDRFVDPRGSEYTLEQLRQKDRETFNELFG